MYRLLYFRPSQTPPDPAIAPRSRAEARALIQNSNAPLINTHAVGQNIMIGTPVFSNRRSGIISSKTHPIKTGQAATRCPTCSHNETSSGASKITSCRRPNNNPR